MITVKFTSEIDDKAVGLERVSRHWAEETGNAFETVEIETVEAVELDPLIDEDRVMHTHRFACLFMVDEIGMWFHDHDGGDGQPIFRTGLIPWANIKSVFLRLKT